MSDEPSSLLAWLARHARRLPDQPAVWRRSEWRLSESDWRSVSWRSWAVDVAHVAQRFIAWGVEPGDRVALLAANCYGWLVCDLALQAAGAIEVPIHLGLSPSQTRRIVEHSGCRFAVVSRTERAGFESAWKGRVELDGVALLDGDSVGVTVDVGRGRARSVALGDLARGELTSSEFASDDERLDWLARCAARQRQTDVLKIIYTSGTTGEPKGVMLTLGNLLSNAQRVASVFGDRPTERKLVVLPLSHVFAQTNDVYSTIVAGSELAFARSRDTWLDDAQAIEPTLINGVPYLFDRVRREVERRRGAGEVITARDLLGRRLEICNAGGAPLPDELFDYFASAGICLLQGYGLTETSPVLCKSTPAANRRGAVGKPLADVELKVAEDGELLVRGPQVMAGYYRDPEATARAFVDGWFRTGDLARIDDGGYVWITGRKKDLIVLATGRKVAPAPIEARLALVPGVAQALVVGEGRDYLGALVVPDRAALPTCSASGLDSARNDAGREGPSGAAGADFASGWSPLELEAYFAARFAERLSDLAPWERVRRVKVVDEPFAAASGELTVKLSLRRDEIARRRMSVIAALYEDR